jgi:hypothetical protein
MKLLTNKLETQQSQQYGQDRVSRASLDAVALRFKEGVQGAIKQRISHVCSLLAY